MMGRHVIPRGFALPLYDLARAQSYRRVIQRAEFPQGNAAHTAPQIKTQYSQYSQYSQSAPPAAAQQTAAAIQNLSTQNYRRVMQRADLPQGSAVR